MILRKTRHYDPFFTAIARTLANNGTKLRWFAPYQSQGSERERQLNELKGALDLLFELREEFAQWVEEAQDGSKREALENVLGHVEAVESEYRTRQEVLKKSKSA